MCEKSPVIFGRHRVGGSHLARGKLGGAGRLSKVPPPSVGSFGCRSLRNLSPANFPGVVPADFDPASCNPSADRFANFRGYLSVEGSETAKRISRLVMYTFQDQPRMI